MYLNSLERHTRANLMHKLGRAAAHIRNALRNNKERPKKAATECGVRAKMAPC